VIDSKSVIRFVEVQQLEAAALPAHRGVGSNDFAEARAVDVGHTGEIQNDFF
jgi:hypothetical protein